MFSRRAFLASVAALSAPGALAQAPGKGWRIGVIGGIPRPDPMEPSIYGGLLLGLRELGYVEGKNLAVEWRFADGKFERFPGFVRELLALKVDLIFAGSTPAAHAAQQATRTVPIVLGASGDPVAAGLVQTLARPGGNTTGLSQNLSDLAPKSLELLKTILPKLSRVATLYNPGNQTAQPIVKSFQSSGPVLGVDIIAMEASSPDQLAAAFDQAVRERAGAVIVVADVLFMGQRKLVADLALKHKLPLLAQQRENAEAGALLTYGRSIRELFRRSATYIDKIFKGAKPADLPVEQPSVFELIVNQNTAKTLGIPIPRTVLMRADRTID